jgi:hypothetical protein
LAGSHPRPNITATPRVTQVGKKNTESTAVPAGDGAKVFPYRGFGMPENASKKEGPLVVSGPEIHKGPLPLRKEPLP